MSVDIRQLLKYTTFRSIDVEELLAPEKLTWVSFDPELGYVPSEIVMQDGMDFSCSTYTYEPAGCRKIINYADRPCRVNTYGDSFTQCQQVSDGETWQEYLAAHIGEPLRNFGSGGYGVYQAYLRARRMEATPCSAEYVILNIFDDDHVRNLDASRWIRTAWEHRDRPPDRGYPLHGLPWSHLRFDLKQGRFVEKPGLCRTEDDLRGLCDPERFYRTFQDDEIVKLFVLEIGGEADIEGLELLAEALGVPVDLRSPEKRRKDARQLCLEYGFQSTEFMLEKMRAGMNEQGKKLMILLSYSDVRVGEALQGQERFDLQFLDYLERTGYRYVDTLPKHIENFRQFRISAEEYIAKCFIQPACAAVFGHHNPAANHFFAFSIKDEVVRWLEPPPPAYRSVR